jgi:hypothetical protein
MARVSKKGSSVDFAPKNKNKKGSQPTIGKVGKI